MGDIPQAQAVAHRAAVLPDAPAGETGFIPDDRAVEHSALLRDVDATAIRIALVADDQRIAHRTDLQVDAAAASVASIALNGTTGVGGALPDAIADDRAAVEQGVADLQGHGAAAPFMAAIPAEVVHERAVDDRPALEAAAGAIDGILLRLVVADDAVGDDAGRDAQAAPLLLLLPVRVHAGDGQAREDGARMQNRHHRLIRRRHWRKQERLLWAFVRDDRHALGDRQAVRRTIPAGPDMDDRAVHRERENRVEVPRGLCDRIVGIFVCAVFGDIEVLLIDAHDIRPRDRPNRLLAFLDAQDDSVQAGRERQRQRGFRRGPLVDRIAPLVL